MTIVKLDTLDGSYEAFIHLNMSLEICKEIHEFEATRKINIYDAPNFLFLPISGNLCMYAIHFVISVEEGKSILQHWL